MIVIMIEWCRTFTWQLDKLGEIRHSPTFKSCFFKFVDLLSAEDALQASRAASLRKGKLVRARLIVDCDGLGIENMRYLSILKKIITLGKSYYPEVAATVTVIRAPGFSAFFYNLLKPLLPKLLQEKIWLLGRDFREGLMKHTGLDAKSLPRFSGRWNYWCRICKSATGAQQCPRLSLSTRIPVMTLLYSYGLKHPLQIPCVPISMGSLARFGQAIGIKRLSHVK